MLTRRPWSLLLPCIDVHHVCWASFGVCAANWWLPPPEVSPQVFVGLWLELPAGVFVWSLHLHVAVCELVKVFNALVRRWVASSYRLGCQ